MTRHAAHRSSASHARTSHAKHIAKARHAKAPHVTHATTKKARVAHTPHLHIGRRFGVKDSARIRMFG